MNLDLLRSFFAVVEFGSLGRAAEHLRVSQSTVSRQLQALEAEVGGQLVARGHRGAALTTAGHALADGMRPVLAKADAVMAEARRLARGHSKLLRIGYLMSAAAEYLNPAIAALRKAHPEIKVRLVDLSPGEQIEALRAGELDVIILGNLNAAIPREFFVRRIATLPVVVALPSAHPLAQKDTLALAELRGESFVGARSEDVPGFNEWITQLSRRAGFRPRFVENATGLTQALSVLVAENAVTLLPGLATSIRTTGVAFCRLRSPAVRWDLQVAWQRGKMTEAVRELVNEFTRLYR